MLKVIQCMIWFLIIPFLLGMIPNYFMKKDKNNILYCFIIGYIMEFAILQIISIPMIYAGLSFHCLLYTFCTIIAVLCIISIVMNRKEWKNFGKENWDPIKKLPLSTIVVVVLIGIQAFALFFFIHVDDDDAFYVGTATTTVQTNTIYKFNGLEGREYKELPSRYILAPFPMYTACMSKLINIHPAIVAHTIFPVIFIFLSYALYAVIANKIFKNDKKSVNLFLILLCILYIFGNYSRRTNFTFLLTRIWQGKAILCNFILPAIILLYYQAIQENHLINWSVLFITMIASCFPSEMGLALAPMALVMIAFVYTIKEKNKNNLIKAGICLIPNIVYLAMYLLIK